MVPRPNLFTAPVLMTNSPGVSIAGTVSVPKPPPLYPFAFIGLPSAVTGEPKGFTYPSGLIPSLPICSTIF